MRYHFEKPDVYLSLYGTTYECDHPVYDRCTLFTLGGKGLAVIQQRWNSEIKTAYWSEIDEWLTDFIYMHPRFKNYLESHAGHPSNTLYPTVTVRQLMWALKMKPLKREQWETCFDRKYV